MVEAAHPNPARRPGARGEAVPPGLIDAHAHAGHGLVKTLGSGDGAAWMEACRVIHTRASPPAFWAAEARLAALKRRMVGVTAGVSLVGGGDSVHRVNDPAAGEARAAAVAEVGRRDVMAVGPSRAYRGASGEVAPVSVERQAVVSGLLFERLRGRGLQRLCALRPVHRGAQHDAAAVRGIAATGRAALALARRFGARRHQDGRRAGSVETAERLFGLLLGNAFLSRCTDLTECDVDSLARTGAHMVHKPGAIAAVRGFCPVVRLRERGVNVRLGSDATAPDRCGDMFGHIREAMRYASRPARGARRNTPRAARDETPRARRATKHLLPPGRALEMAAVDATRALGMEGEIDSLAPGILAAQGGVTGAFSSVQPPASGILPGTRFDTLNFPGAVDLVVTPLSFADLSGSGIGVSRNQRAVGHALDAVRPAAGARLSGRAADLFDTLYALPAGRASRAR